MQGLKHKRVLITGGASGIGAATAARFLEEGAQVCILDRDAESLRIHPPPTPANLRNHNRRRHRPQAGRSRLRPSRPSHGRSRHPHQQRRHQHPPQLPRHHSRRMGQGNRRQPHRSLLRSPNRRPPHVATAAPESFCKPPPPTASWAIPTTPTTTPPKPESSS